MYQVMFAFGAWLTRTVLIKWVVFTALAAVMLWASSLLADVLARCAAALCLAGGGGVGGGGDGAATLASLLLSIPPGLWWALDLLRFDVGLQVLLCAWVTRFLIRRIPVIG